MTFNDMGILGLIILFFLASATFIPMVQDGFNEKSYSVNSSVYGSNIVDSGHDVESLNPLSIGGVFINVFKLAFIGFSGLPFFVDLFFTFLAVIFILLMVKFIPTIGSGG